MVQPGRIRDGLQAHVDAGGVPMAIASADAGNSFYHPRANGEDAGAMITEEFVPLLAERGLRTEAFGLAGISMGGYGGLLLADRLGPERVRAVAAASPALWQDAASSAYGAFDSADDHVRHNVFGRQGNLEGIAVRVDCGESDPFISATRAHVAEFAELGVDTPEHSFGPGGHNVDYWRSLVPDQLRLLSAHVDRSSGPIQPAIGEQDVEPME